MVTFSCQSYRDWSMKGDIATAWLSTQMYKRVLISTATIPEMSVWKQGSWWKGDNSELAPAGSQIINKLGWPGSNSLFVQMPSTVVPKWNPSPVSLLSYVSCFSRCQANIVTMVTHGRWRLLNWMGSSGVKFLLPVMAEGLVWSDSYTA